MNIHTNKEHFMVENQEVLKRLNEQQSLLNNLQEQVGQSDHYMTSLLEQLSQSVPSKDIELIAQGSILIGISLLILLTIISLFKDVPKWKKLKMKKPFVMALTHNFNVSLLFTGAVMLGSAFIKLSFTKDPLFFSIFTVMGTTLISVGLSLGLSTQQKIEKLEDDAKLIVEIKELIRGKKIKNSSDIQSLRDMEMQLKSLLKNIKKNKSTDPSQILQQEINRIDNILKNYEE